MHVIRVHTRYGCKNVKKLLRNVVVKRYWIQYHPVVTMKYCLPIFNTSSIIKSFNLLFLIAVDPPAVATPNYFHTAMSVEFSRKTFVSCVQAKI